MLNSGSIADPSRARPVESSLRKFRERGLENDGTSIDCTLLLATLPLGTSATTRWRRPTANRARIARALAVFHSHAIIAEIDWKGDHGLRQPKRAAARR